MNFRSRELFSGLVLSCFWRCAAANSTSQQDYGMKRRHKKPAIFAVLGIFFGMAVVLYFAWESDMLDFSVFEYYRDVEEMADPNADF